MIIAYTAKGFISEIYYYVAEVIFIEKRTSFILPKSEMGTFADRVYTVRKSFAKFTAYGLITGYLFCDI